MKKTILASTLLLSLAFTTIPAHAATFVDTPDNHKYFNSIEYLANNQIVQGTGNGNFQPDRYVTIHELAIMIRNAFAPEARNSGALPYCFHREWMPMYIATKDPNSPITRGDAYDMLSRVEGISVYPENGIYVLNTDYLRTMKVLGLAEETANTEEFITRGEAAYLIHSLKEYDYKTPLQGIFEGMNVKHETSQNLGNYERVIRELPDTIINAFKNDNWTLVFDKSEILKLNEENDILANAWTSYEEKSIYLYNIASIDHEFGHFFHYLIGFPIEFERLYNEEAGAFNEVYNDSGYNEHEYFASYFAALMAYTNNPEKMKELESLTPKTFNYFRNLDELKKIFE